MYIYMYVYICKVMVCIVVCCSIIHCVTSVLQCVTVCHREL